MRGYWAIAEKFLTSFYGNTFKRDRSFHFLRFLHYRDNNAEIKRKGNNCDRLWKIRTIFDTLNDAYETYDNPSEHLAADEINFRIQREGCDVRLCILECSEEYHTKDRFS
jgi:hypothetical protein